MERHTKTGRREIPVEIFMRRTVTLFRPWFQLLNVKTRCNVAVMQACVATAAMMVPRADIEKVRDVLTDARACMNHVKKKMQTNPVFVLHVISYLFVRRCVCVSLCFALTAMLRKRKREGRARAVRSTGERDDKKRSGTAATA